MRLIKLGLLSFVGLFGVITLFSLLIPSHIRISKAVNLANNKGVILPYLNNKDRWSDWHPAFTSSEGRSKMAGVDFKLRQNSDSLVLWQMLAPGKRPIGNGFQLHTYPSSDSLTLQWYMDFDLPWYPWQKFGSLFYESTYGVMMEQGLANLKTRLN